MAAVKETKFNFPKQTGFYKGKVRDVYFFGDKMIMVASDRISAFDCILPEPIPYKGQILNQIAWKSLNATKDIVPNWAIELLDPQVTAGFTCETFAVEMVIRGYLSGHAWREYKSGKRSICGVGLPDGLKENDKLPKPIITPTTKAVDGAHDEDISREGILKQGIVSEEEYIKLEEYTQKLFARGSELADEQGLILVDTKYEFGKKDGVIYLIDEIHTPDSSRYFYKEGYLERQTKGEAQKQLSKEFVRQWLISEGFQGLEGQKMPVFTQEVIKSITNRYTELYEKFTGQKFVKTDGNDPLKRIESNMLTFIKKL